MDRLSAGIGSVVSSKALLHGWCRIAIAIVLYVYTITASQACSTSFKRPSMNTENHISDKLHHSCTSNFSDTTALIETLYFFLITHTPTYKSQTITPRIHLPSHNLPCTNSFIMLRTHTCLTFHVDALQTCPITIPL